MTLLLSTLFSSCGSVMDAVNSSVGHAGRVLGIQKSHEDCLASAQTQEDIDNCNDKYQNALDNENEQYENEQNAIKEKDKYEAYLYWLLKGWGYSEKEAKQIARKHRDHKDSDYSFDADEAISELIRDGYKDKVAIQKFEMELPKYGVSKDNAEQVTKEYYDNAYYTRENLFKEPYFYLIGNSVYCNRKMLIEMGFIEEEDDNNGEDNDGNISESPNTPDQETPQPQKPAEEMNNNYQAEANTITRLSISQYKLNKAKLTSEQKTELDEVVSFMKKWPNVKISIIGHTCSMGTDAINNIVGLRRAHEAKLYMIAQGIDESRIDEVSKAASEPCTGNDTEKGRLQNRRITFIVK